MKHHKPQAIICDIPVSTDTLDDHCCTIIRSLKEDGGLWVVTLNLQMIYRARKYQDYRALLQKADLFIADGVPLIWASKLKRGTPAISGRSNGTDLVEKLLKAVTGVRLGVIGGHQPEKVVKSLNPGLLNDAYFYDERVDPSDERFILQLIEEVEKAEVKLLLLGLGVPKQDELACRIREKIGGITVIGVGGAFDLLSGRKVRAPRWMQRNGLEWLHRLLSEPRRLSRRYLIHYPQALWAIIKDIGKV